MKPYSLGQLAIPETYVADSELATLARRVAESCTDIDLPIGERKRLALSGGMAQAVFEALAALQAATNARAATQETCRVALAGITLPAGWTLALSADQAEFIGPVDEVMHAGLRRHGAWDPARRVWRVPISSGQTLARSLKRAAGPAAAAVRQQRDDERRRQELQRWIGYVEDSAREGRVYQRGVEECRARAVADFADLQQRLTAALSLATERAAAISKARTAQSAARQAKWVAEHAQRTETRTRRVLWPLSLAPAIGRPCRWAGVAIVYTGSGQPFRISDEHPSLGGSHLLGHEGAIGAYFYYRAATEDETAALDAADNAARAVQLERGSHDAAIRELALAVSQMDNLVPHGSEPPRGDVVRYASDANRGEWLLIEGRAAVWCVRANGADGDDWSRNNLPGAIAWRSTDPHLIERARALLPP